MEDTLLVNQAAQAFYAAFRKMPMPIREKFTEMITTPKKKKKKYADDTEYLSRNEAIKADMLQSIQDVKDRKNLITYTPEEWDKFVAETLEKKGK